LNSSAAAIAANSSWFTLDNLKLLLSDGGILDWEDTIKEVIDDKEQVSNSCCDSHTDNTNN